jgi:hypothetical protein
MTKFLLATSSQVLRMLRRDEARRRRNLEKAQKESFAQQEYARKIAEESERRRQAEGVIDLLEKEEKDLIERLKKTQQMQQKVVKNVIHCSFSTLSADKNFLHIFSNFKVEIHYRRLLYFKIL